MDRKHYEPEHIAFGEAVRAFIDKEMVPNFLEWEQIGSAPRELFQVAGQNGFLGMAVPEEYGGGGVSDFRFNQAMNEQMAYAGVTGAGLGLTLHNDTCLPYFLTYATDQQRRRWLARHCVRRADHSGRHDGAGRRLGPHGNPDQRGA